MIKINLLQDKLRIGRRPWFIALLQKRQTWIMVELYQGSTANFSSGYSLKKVKTIYHLRSN